MTDSFRSEHNRTEHNTMYNPSCVVIGAEFDEIYLFEHGTLTGNNSSVMTSKSDFMTFRVLLLLPSLERGMSMESEI